MNVYLVDSKQGVEITLEVTKTEGEQGDGEFCAVLPKGFDIVLKSDGSTFLLFKISKEDLLA